MNRKILVISNGAISNTDANGRTVARLLDDFSKDQKAQFFTYWTPDFSQCNSFYKVTDNDALNSLIKFERKNGRVRENICELSNTITEKPSIKKTPSVLIMREIVWKFGRWKNKYLKSWIDEVNPACIFLNLGDNAYTVDLAVSISRDRLIPIIVYSTEEYVFKDYNYVTQKKSLSYFIWHQLLKRSYMRLNEYAKVGFFNSEELSKLYASRYTYPCKTLYQNSDIDYIENYRVKACPRVSYLGNLGLNRFKALIAIAEALLIVDSNIIFEIYGTADEAMLLEMSRMKNIRIHSFIPYADVVKVIHESSLLVHAEYSDEFYNRDLKYTFSTKITDSVCSGTPLLMYTPRNLSGSEFVIQNQCAFYTDSKDDLVKQLQTALYNEDERRRIVSNALKVKKKYFTNRETLKLCIEEILNESITN